MSKWSTDDVLDFMHDRACSAEVVKLLRANKVNGRRLLRLAKDSALLMELGMSRIRAQCLIRDVEEYKSDNKSSDSKSDCVALIVVFVFHLCCELIAIVLRNSVLWTSIRAYSRSFIQ